MFSAYQRVALLGLFALLIIFRLPNAWAEGRFQDEEATVFLAYAWHYPWTDALFRPFAGYWNLAANATTVFLAQLLRSEILPMEFAPYFTMIVALLFQLLPAILILAGEARWLGGRLAVIGALLVIALIPTTEEVFLNVLHIQIHLALCVGIILALDVPRRRAGRVAYDLLLFVAPLCGPGAIVFVPMFALRAWLDKDAGRRRQFAVLAAGAAVQLTVFYGSSPVRGQLLETHLTVAAIFIRLIAMPILGIRFANTITIMLDAPGELPMIRGWLFAAAATLIFVGLIVIVARRRDSAPWLVCSALLLAGVSFGIGMITVNPADVLYARAGGRYNFVPVVLLGLALIALARRPDFRGRYACAYLCLLMIVTGAYHYRSPHWALVSGPSWQGQVRSWRSNHDHQLAVWPEPWAADLSDRAYACSPPIGKPGVPTEPRYCENGWVAAFYEKQTTLQTDQPR